MVSLNSISVCSSVFWSEEMVHWFAIASAIPE